MNQLSDAALMRRVQAHDPRAFEALYDRHAGRALAVATTVLRSRERAEDAVQEAFASAWRRCDTYRPERGSVQGWLLAIVRNRAIDAIRRAGVHERPWEALEQHDPPDVGIEAADAGAARRDEARVLRAALAGLPREQAATLQLVYFGGFTQAEIASRTGIPLGTVKGRIRLGMRRLETLLVPALGPA
jgi:RNA polymerase sigma-70 factor, ECF subfamily